MKKSWPMILVALVAAACLKKIELPPSDGDTSSAGADGASDDVIPDAGPAPCGLEAQACCAEPEPACGAGLRCDAPAQRCVIEEPRLCATDAQCHSGQACCKSGLLGNCVTLAPNAACPTADLVIVSTQETLSFSREERRFDPATSAADACAIEKGCVGAPGLRQLLRFSVKVENQGDADLILGDPTRSSEFQTAQCDGQPYFPSYLSYELVEIADGAPVPGARGQVEAQCQELPAGFSSRFSCEFRGLWSGFSESYVPAYAATPPYAAAADCQWIDITGIAARDYELRVTVNPGGKLDEPISGNSQNFAVSIPALDDPLQPCPLPAAVGSEASLTGGDLLLGFGTARECGWSALPIETCTPNETVTLGCACEGSQGDPMLRICEGSGPCSAGAALSAGNDTVRLYRNNVPDDDDLSEVECDVRLTELLASEPNVYVYCGYVSGCPRVRFTCPASGTYTTLRSSSYPAWDSPITCEVTPQISSIGGDVAP